MQIIIKFHKIGGNQCFIKEISKKQFPLKVILLQYFQNQKHKINIT